MACNLCVLKETRADEKRVAMAPSVAIRAEQPGAEFFLETGAGHLTTFAETGMVFVNHPTKVEADLPFGGIRRLG